DLKWIYPHDWSPDGKFIAAHVQRQDRSAQIALISVQNGSIHPLKTVDWRGPTGIFFSPNGEYLAYDLPTDDRTGNHAVFVIAVDGSRDLPAVTAPSQDAVVGWSPDGKRLLFASDRSGSTDLWSIGFADGNVHGVPELLRRSVGSPTRFETLGMTSAGAVY